MELKWVEDFLEVAASGSFSRSADRRHVTQPAFSRRIRALEHWLGAPLIDRSTYPTCLTPAGERFAEFASRMVLDAYRVREELRAARADASVHFAALHTLAIAFFPRWIAGAIEQVGPIRTQVSADNMHDCIELLSAGSCDFLLSYSHPAIDAGLNLDRFNSVRLSHDKMVPVIGRAVTLDQLGSTKIPYLRYSDHTLLGQIVQLIIANNSAQAIFDPRYENSMSEALKTMALNGAGLAWLPLSAVRDELDRGDLQVVFDASWQMDLEVRLYRGREHLRPESEQLWSYATAAQTPLPESDA